MDHPIEPREHAQVPEPAIVTTPAPAGGRKRGWRDLGGVGVGIAVLFAKFKVIALTLLFNLKWLFVGGKLLSVGSFFASIWVYSWFFGPKFAVAFVLLIAVHEAGHALFARAYGLPTPPIYFVPLLGAVAMLKRAPERLAQSAMIAWGGPFVGTLGAIACFGYGAATHSDFWTAVAYTGFMLNLFNMIPIGMLDGGRITAVISPFFWIVGLAVVAGLAVGFHWFSPILLIVALLSVPRAVAAFRGRVDPRYFDVTGAERGRVALAYFALLAVLASSLLASHVVVAHPVA